MIHLVFILGWRWPRWLVAIVATALLANPLAAEPISDPCAPVASEATSLPDLQQGAYALCRAVFGDRAPGPLAERMRLRIGGWADGSYRDTDHSEDHTVISLDHANLNVDVRLDERWQLFFEGEWEHETEFEGRRDEREWEVEQLYGEYRHSDAVRLRLGRLSTPFGHWTPLHWSILVDTIEAPIHERNRVVPEQQIGARLHGVLFGDDLFGVESEVDYSLFGGYAEDGFDVGNADGLTLGSDFGVRLAREYRAGFSLYTQENGDEADRRETSGVLYGEARLPWRFFTRAEYVRQRRDGSTRPGLVRDVDIFYAKLRWDFHDDAYLNYRFELGEDDRYGFTSDLTVHRVTFGYRPIPRVLVKAEWARYIYANPRIENYHFWGASAGVFF